MPESAGSYAKRREAVLCAWQKKVSRCFAPKRPSQTSVCDTSPKPAGAGQIVFHNPCLKVKLPKRYADRAVNQPKRRIPHRPASDPKIA